MRTNSVSTYNIDLMFRFVIRHKTLFCNPFIEVSFDRVFWFLVLGVQYLGVQIRVL